MLSLCRHCGNPLRGADSHALAFCCLGCEAAYHLLEKSGLLRYYDLRQEPRAPALPDDPALSLWAERTQERLRQRSEATTLRVSVDGMHCSACVWLLEELTRRSDGSASVRVNPAIGTAELDLPADFPFVEFVLTLERLGYRLGPEAAADARPSDDLLWRVGVTVAIALNVMSFAVARYAGLTDESLGRTLSVLELALTTISLLVGGPVFFRSAWAGLRRGVLHMDLPIAVGLLCSWGGSVLLTLSGRPDAAFYDTASIFLALMLVGRFLRERVLEKNRTFLRGHDDAAALLVRRKESDANGTRVTVIPARAIAVGDELVLGPRDVTPVAGELLTDGAHMSAAWITGESTEHLLARSDAVRAGMANAESRTISLRATETLASSNLLALMQAPRKDERYGDSPSAIEATIARHWVMGVGLAAALGAVWAHHRGADLHASLAMLTTILVVTCPCGFGLATPLAQELMHLRLRKEGVLVRSCTLLERLLDIHHIVFDKTGTLTDVRLAPDSQKALAELPERDALVLANLAQRSRHPKSRALMAELDRRGASAWLELDAIEEPGRGLVARLDGDVYALGSPTWDRADVAGDVEFSKNGQPLLRAATDDRIIEGTKEALALLGGSGRTLHLLSGDATARALRTGRELGISDQNIRADAVPSDKSAYLEALGGGTLFVGDGLNDALAAATATLSGTPSRGATFLASRTDFYLLGQGVPALPRLFDAATTLAAARRRCLAWALAYNVVAVGLAVAGLMSPLVAAVLMPLSTVIAIGIILVTTRPRVQSPARLEPRNLAWTPST